MPTIFHIADLHIGASFDSLPPEKASAAISMQFSALDKLIQRANDCEADAILIAGDLFDSPTPRADIASAVFATLGKSRCPIFLSPGNHDYYFSQSPYATLPLPSCLTVFDDRILTPVELDDGRTVIWGAAFQAAKANIRLNAEVDPEKINICVLHGELGGDNGYNPISERAAMISGFDYIALGHNHTYSGMFRAGDTVLSCPGCFSPTSVNETGEKVYLTGTVEKGAVDLHPVRTDALCFQRCSIRMDGIESDKALAEALKPLLPQHPECTCCALTLTGTRSFEPSADLLLNALQNIFFHATLRDESTVPENLLRYLDDEGLRGEVTRDLKARIDASDEVDADNLTLALEYVLAALDGRPMTRESKL